MRGVWDKSDVSLHIFADFFFIWKGLMCPKKGPIYSGEIKVGSLSKVVSFK